jgi:hypothetical protein
MVHVKKNFSILAPDLLRSAGLILVSALVWCTIMHRWSVDAWRTPLEYTANPERSGDALCYFAEVKAALDGRYRPIFQKHIPELGAPFGANWDDYPMTEEIIVVSAALLARAVGIFAACNLLTMFAQILAALSMYAVCRLLHGNWRWSFAAAIAYGFASYAFAHSEHHLDLIFYWHVPLCLLVARWVSVGDGLSSGKFLSALLIAFVTGLQNQYYTFMFIQLVVLGGIAQGLRRGWRAVFPALAICGASLLGFLILIADTLVFQISHGRNPGAVERRYSQMEFYALKIVDMLVPFPGHRFFSGLAKHYSEIVLVRGEVPPASYLGLFGIAGLITLAITTFVRQVKRTGSIPLEAAQALWIVLQANVGGLNALLGLFGFYLFRVTGRYSIFVLALALFFLVRQLSNLTKAKPILCSIGSAVVIVAVLLDQTPTLVARSEIEQTASAIDSDKRFVELIESRLPAGAMILQLPAIQFPEAFPIACYEHFRPYLFSTRLRFSFGAVKGRAQDEWMNRLKDVSAEEAVRILKQYGFMAIYVDRGQYQDHGEELFEGFAKMGMPIVQSSRGDLFCVLLNPG